MGGVGFWSLVEDHWRRGSCVIIDASQPHLALGLGIHGASGIPRGACYMYLHVPSYVLQTCRYFGRLIIALRKT